MSDNLAAALAAVQAELPEIRKGETATVQTKQGGTYKYSYADLADVSQVILPLLGKNGLAWITKPTYNEAGKFVLVYKLRHVSGDEECGEYPLNGGTAQEIGSAITYARRYALCAVTGVAPAADDDDGAAASTRRDQWGEAKPPQPQITPEQARQNIIANARAAIATAQLDDLRGIELRVLGAVERSQITGDDADELLTDIQKRSVELLPEKAVDPGWQDQ